VYLVTERRQPAEYGGTYCSVVFNPNLQLSHQMIFNLLALLSASTALPYTSAPTSELTHANDPTKCLSQEGVRSDDLMKYAVNPNEYPAQVPYYDNNLILLNNKFPKSKIHVMLIPRIPIASVWELNSSHLGVLEQFSKRLDIFRKNNNHVQFQAGFHAIPSMSQLHLHIISQDFISPCLVTKKHYLSYTTPFFIDFENVIESIQKQGKFNHVFNNGQFKDFLKGDLVCHKCNIVLKDMPTLKNHLLTH
jgi:aprataxin